MEKAAFRGIWVIFEAYQKLAEASKLTHEVDIEALANACHYIGRPGRRGISLSVQSLPHANGRIIPVAAGPHGATRTDHLQNVACS
jgi:hypothetical protein